MEEVKLNYPIVIALSLVTLAASSPQKLFLHYRYSAGIVPMTSEILVKDSLVYRLVSGKRQDPVPCKTASLRPGEIRELLRRLDASDLMPTRSDPDFICEGSRSLLITTKRKSLAIHESCKIKKEMADKAIDSTMDAFSNYLVGIIERQNRLCDEGYYYSLRKSDSASMAAKGCAVNGKSISNRELNQIGINGFLSEPVDFPAFPFKFPGDSSSAKALGGRTFQVGPSCFEIEMTRYGKDAKAAAK
jgi:hypothetical protein